MTERSASFDLASIAEGDELVFDDAGPEIVVEAPPKRLKTGRKTKMPDAPAPEPDVAIEAFPIDVPAEPVPPSFDPAPAAASATAPKLPIPAWLLIAAVGLSLFTSTVACVGLLVASRTIAHADQAREAAEAQTVLLAHLPAALERIDQLVTQEQAALARLRLGRAGQPATIGDLQRGLDGLRTAIVQVQPQRDQEMAALTKAGQAEISERLGAISEAIEHLKSDGSKRGR